MTKNERERYLYMPTEGYTSHCGGISVKKIEYGIEDYVIFVAGEMSGKPTVHRTKIYYYTDRPHFLFYGKRIYFDDIYCW